MRARPYDGRLDNHNHISFADSRDMVEAAKANDLAEYSITEHVSQFRPLRESVRFGSVHSAGRIFANLEEYDMECRKIDGYYPSVKIHQGLEVDFAPRFGSRVADFVNQAEWDILLCSVHKFEDASDVERTAGRTSEQEAHARWRDYFRLERLALESDFVPFDVLSHPVRMARALKVFPPEMDELLLDLAMKAKRRDKALELNGNDMDYAPDLVRRLAIACSKNGCKVSLGSDAHYPREVFRNMETAISMVRQFNLELYHPKSKL